MTKIELFAFMKNQLGSILTEDGDILFSSHETLKKGEVYLLGFNPGGNVKRALGSVLEGLPTQVKNAYVDERWRKNETEYAPIQKRITWLLEQLGLDVKDVCASNLIFSRSKDAHGVSYSLAELCWPVHEEIIAIVQPKIIFTYGNGSYSPYGYLKASLGGEEEAISAHHGTWQVKGFCTEHQGRTVYVVGLPHLSRYEPNGRPGVLEWLQAKFARYS